MNTEPVPTYPCGCTGPAYLDDRQNLYITPRLVCAVHRLGPRRLYRCGCNWSRTNDLVRCPEHEEAHCPKNKSFYEFGILVTRECGCVGLGIGTAFEKPYLLYYVAAENVCATHRAAGAMDAIVLSQCDCALAGSDKCIMCHKHAAASESRASDPFTKPRDKPVYDAK